MDTRHRSTHLLIGGALACAAASIGFHSATTAWALWLFPVALRFGYRSHQGYVIALVFYLVAGMGLVPGIHALSSNLPSALLGWIVPAAVLALPFLLVYCFPRTGMMIALTLTIMPPIGLMALPTPLIVAGFVFPDGGLIGLGLVLVIMQAIHSVRLPRAGAAALTVSLLGVSSYSTAHIATPETTTWVGIDTRYGDELTADRDYIADYRIQSKVRTRLPHIQTGLPVFPEAAAGRLTQAAINRLRSFSEETGRAYLIGAEEFADSQQLNNVLLSVSAQAVDVVYRQRMPAPWFMYRGSQAGFFKAGLSRPATFALEQRRIGVLICYELALPFLVLTTHLAKPDVVLVASNYWWGRQTNLPALVRLHAASWSRLFGVPYVTAMNT